jgi:hypothetical protein
MEFIFIHMHSKVISISAYILFHVLPCHLQDMERWSQTVVSEEEVIYYVNMMSGSTHPEACVH